MRWGLQGRGPERCNDLPHLLGLHKHRRGHTADPTPKTQDHQVRVLGGMTSLEQVDLYQCNGVTDAGLIFLARLPRLREVNLDGLPGVTPEGARVFPELVRVRYCTGSHAACGQRREAIAYPCRSRRYVAEVRDARRIPEQDLR